MDVLFLTACCCSILVLGVIGIGGVAWILKNAGSPKRKPHTVHYPDKFSKLYFHNNQGFNNVIQFMDSCPDNEKFLILKRWLYYQNKTFTVPRDVGADVEIKQEGYIQYFLKDATFGPETIQLIFDNNNIKEKLQVFLPTILEIISELQNYSPEFTWKFLHELNRFKEKEVTEALINTFKNIGDNEHKMAINNSLASRGNILALPILYQDFIKNNPDIDLFDPNLDVSLPEHHIPLAEAVIDFLGSTMGQYDPSEPTLVKSAIWPYCLLGGRILLLIDNVNGLPDDLKMRINNILSHVVHEWTEEDVYGNEEVGLASVRYWDHKETLGSFLPKKPGDLFTS